MQQRDGHLDVARGLGISLAVFEHNWLVVHEKGELFNVGFTIILSLKLSFCKAPVDG